MNNIEAAVNKYCPIIYLHSKEKYFPTTFDEYVKLCSLYYDDTPVDTSVTLDNLYRTQIDGKAVDNPFLWNLHTEYQGYRSFNNDVPIYAKVNDIDNDTIEIIYIFFYGYNGGYNIFTKEVGKHYADIEHITIQLDKTNYDIKNIYYAAHGRKWGAWIDPKKIEYSSDNRLTIYSSKYSHASYWKKGIYGRIFGFANDKCDKGYQWSPRVVILGDEDFLKYAGTWGFSSVRALAYKDWWNKENGLTAKWWKRIFLPCLLK